MPQISFKKPSNYKSYRYSIININVDKFDKAWSESAFYAYPGEVSLKNPNKLEYYKKQIENNENIEWEMPEAKIGKEKGQKIVGIIDGRHRYIILRGMGYKIIPIMVPKKQTSVFIKKFS
jgi:hypothetical protein